MKQLQYENIYQELPPQLKETDTVSLDLELSGLNELQLHRPAGRFVSLACSFDGKNAYIIEDDSQIQEFLDRISSATWIFHNSVFDLGHLKRWAKVEERKNMRDTLLIERLMWSNYFSDFKLSDLVRRYLKCYMPKDVRKEFHDHEGRMTWEQIEYASLDVIGTWLVDQEQQKIIDKHDMTIWNNMYNPHVWTTLELGGFKLNVDCWKSLTEENQRIVDEIELDLGNKYGQLVKKMTGRGKNKVEVEEFVPFNPASSAQVLKILKAQGVNVDATGDDVIRPYYNENAFVKNILDYRKSAKLVSTYGLEFLKYVEPDGRIYTSLNISLAETGRDSSSSPNLQNIPKTKERRACFTAGEGNVLVLYDYSGQEACIFAYITGDPLLKEIINSGKKLYIEVARMAFNEIIEKDTKRYDVVKALVLGLMYGLTPYGFARDNEIDMETAENMYEEFFQAFPTAGQWVKAQQSYNKGMTKTILGRRCHVHPYDWQWKNNQLNNPMQGCIDGSSLVLSQEHGIIEISNLVGEMVSIWDGEQFSDASVVSSGYKQKVIVTLQNGQEILCSPDHKFMTINAFGTKKWRTSKEIGELKGRIWIELSGKVWDYSGADYVPTNFSKLSPTSHTESLLKMSNKEMGIWVGRVASDGSVNKNKGVRLLIAEHEKEILPYLEFLTSKIFTPKVKKVVRDGKLPMYQIDIAHAELSRFLVNEGIKTKIPNFISLDRERLRGYLIGMFDGDGTVNKDGAYLTFGKTHTHYHWAQEIAVALSIFGISARINKCSDKINVRILKRDMPKFSQEFPFLNSIKQRKSEKITPQAPKNDWGGIYGHAVGVKSVVITDKNIPMYDVVDSETEKFMVNGVVTHNSASDMIKIAMKKFRKTEFYKTYYPQKKVFFVLQVHDELIVEMEKSISEEGAEILRQCMIETAELIHPGIKGNVSGGIIENWASK